jgi:hypothetical protein
VKLLDLLMSLVMFAVGFIVANFIATRLHGRTKLVPFLSVALIIGVLALFTYLATYYAPEGLSGEELAERLRSVKIRRAALVVGEVSGLARYFFNLRKARA